MQKNRLKLAKTNKNKKKKLDIKEKQSKESRKVLNKMSIRGINESTKRANAQKKIIKKCAEKEKACTKNEKNRM